MTRFADYPTSYQTMRMERVQEQLRYVDVQTTTGYTGLTQQDVR